MTEPTPRPEDVGRFIVRRVEERLAERFPDMTPEERAHALARIADDLESRRDMWAAFIDRELLDRSSVPDTLEGLDDSEGRP